MSETHARLSPSSAKRWMICPAAPALERGQPDSPSRYAAEGTLAHELAADVLREGRDLAEVVGDRYMVDGFEIEVDADMVQHVMVYVDYVRQRVAYHEGAGASVTLEVEQAVPLEHLTGEPGAEGTADAVIMSDYPDGRMILDVIDLKFGRGVVVNAEGNPQLMLYAAGAWEKFSLAFEPTEIHTHIMQPRVATEGSRSGYSPEEVRRWAENDVEQAAQMAMALLNGEGDPHQYLNPHEDACRFCKAAATCPALRSTAVAAVSADEFDDISGAGALPQMQQAVERVAEASDETLDRLYPALDLVEQWVGAVRARIEQRLLDGATLLNAKLVLGKAGNRAWKDETQAEKLLQAMRLKHDQMYAYKLISPTTAEKLAKAGDIGPRQWPKLQQLITRPDGKPTVVPMSDKRDAWVPQLPPTEFEDLTAQPEALA